MNRAEIILALLALSTFDGAFSFHQLVHFANDSPRRSTSNNERAPKPPLARKSTPTQSRQRRKGVPPTTPTASFALPELSSLATTAAPPFEFVTGANASPIPLPPPIVVASSSAALTYLSLVVSLDRPQGSFAVPDPETSLVARRSGAPDAGLGLFAGRSMPEGTVLGTYAGVLRPARAFYDGKCRRHPGAVAYSWRFTDDQYVIDPTDSGGEIRDVCFGGSDVPLSDLVFGTLLRSWSVSTALCRINEPPRGAGGCNVSAKEDLGKRTVVFTLVRDVVAGQELYLDYGLDYDRSGYGPPPGER